jgi:hypothetical protein
MATQCYFGSDFYEAVSDTVAGESPTTTPGKWQRLAIPADFKTAIALMAAAALLDSQGKPEQSAKVRQDAEVALVKARTEAIQREGESVALNVVMRS